MLDEFFLPLVFECKQCPATLNRQYLTFQTLLEHHFQAHETIFPRAYCFARVLSHAETIGRRNTHTWQSALGDVHEAQDEREVPHA